jgi:hypothetical protein
LKKKKNGNEDLNDCGKAVVDDNAEFLKGFYGGIFEENSSLPTKVKFFGNFHKLANFMAQLRTRTAFLGFDECPIPAKKKKKERTQRSTRSFLLLYLLAKRA